MSAPGGDKKGEPGRFFGPPVGIILGLWLVAAPVFGQTGAGNPVSIEDSAPQIRLPKERTALTLSLVGTLLPFGLVALMTIPSDEDFGIPGLFYPLALTAFAGPSAGFYYGGCWGRGLLTTGLRTAASILVLSYTLEYDERDNSTLVWTYLAGMAVSAVWDLATVKKTVRRRNGAILAKRGLAIEAGPFPLPKGAGVQLRLSF